EAEDGQRVPQTLLHHCYLHFVCGELHGRRCTSVSSTAAREGAIRVPRCVISENNWLWASDRVRRPACGRQRASQVNQVFTSERVRCVHPSSTAAPKQNYG